ncbi:hypothetical protein [Alloactinosynnema sp. L-07]|nr:hypothetical protein [Alloactinosynnema sp. L-07]
MRRLASGVEPPPPDKLGRTNPPTNLRSHTRSQHHTMSRCSWQLSSAFCTIRGMTELPISEARDLERLEEAEDAADLTAIREALGSSEARIPHREVLRELGIA